MAHPFFERRHLGAAEAVWDHCVETVHRVFGEHQPDHVVTLLLSALREAGAAGLDGSEQRDLFHRHLSGSRLSAARKELERRGIARTFVVETAGRPRIVTQLVTPVSPASPDSRTLWSLSSPPQSHPTEPETHVSRFR